MPNGKTRRTLSFDTRSVMLFAALSMGGAALQAQTSSSSTHSTSSSQSTSSSNRLQSGPPGTGSSSGTGLRASPGGSNNGSTQTAQSTIHAAFARADANQDGQLSPAEAASFPAIGNRFKELDRDRDGSLSLQEFQAGASS